MPGRSRATRPYTSHRRRAQAAETRRQVLDAAGRLFTTQSYAGTTINSIAQEAGVSAETIYGIFGSKRALLAELIRHGVAGADESTPLLQREGPQAVIRSTSQEEQVRLFSGQMREIMARVGPLFEVLHGAAAVEPDIARLLAKVLDQRLEGMRHFVRALSANGPLRGGLDSLAAAETVWAITSAEVHWLLRVHRKWPAERYEDWLAGVLAALLLPETRQRQEASTTLTR